MLESSFEKKFLEEVKKLPRTYVPPKVDAPSVRGIPDRILCVNGKFVALEFKRSGADLKRSGARLQEFTLNEIEKAGGFSRFVFPANRDMVMNLIKELAFGR